MTATTHNRNTPSVSGHRRGYPVAAAALCLAGTIAVIDADGMVQPGVTGLNQVSPTRDEKIDPAFITDLSVGYWLSDAVKLTVGGENIFNRRPQQLNDEAKKYYFAPTDNPTYSWYSPYGLDGAYYFAKVDVSW